MLRVSCYSKSMKDVGLVNLIELVLIELIGVIILRKSTLELRSIVIMSYNSIINHFNCNINFVYLCTERSLWRKDVQKNATTTESPEQNKIIERCNPRRKQKSTKIRLWQMPIIFRTVNRMNVVGRAVWDRKSGVIFHGKQIRNIRR